MRALEYALWLLGKRQYTEKGLREKLSSKQYQPPDIDRALKFCIERGYINDMEYAKSFIRSRDAYNPRGRRLLFFELIKKGVSKEDVEKVFADGEVLNRDERLLAQSLVKRKARQYATLERGKAYQRLYGLLARKGFDLQIIRSVLDEQFKRRD